MGFFPFFPTGGGGSPSGPAGGDLTGTYPNPTVTSFGGTAIHSAAGLTTAQVAQTANNLSDLASAPTARTNLGLGSAAVLTSAQVAQTANNLSDLASASTARSNLGLAFATPVSFTPASPAATASTTQVMMGLGSTCHFTPLVTGLVLVALRWTGTTNTAAVTITSGPRFGTGTAPVNGAAVTGTLFGLAADVAWNVNNSAPLQMSAYAVLTLTPSTAYWFDIAASTSAGADTAAISNISMSFTELLS